MSRTTYTASMYGTETDRLAAQLLLFAHGFVLADVDAWLQQSGLAEPVQQHYQVARDELVQAVIAGNDAAARAGVAHLRLTMHADRREEFLVPEAKLGQKSRAAHRAAALQGGKLTAAQVDRIKALYTQRVQDGERYGAVKALAAQFNVSRTTISGIVNTDEK